MWSLTYCLNVMFLILWHLVIFITIQWSLVKLFLIILFSAHCCRFMCLEGPHLRPKTMTSQAPNMDKSVVLLLEASQTCRWCCSGLSTGRSRASNFLGDHDDPLQQSFSGSALLSHQRALQKYIYQGICLGCPSNTWLYRGSFLLV